MGAFELFSDYFTDCSTKPERTFNLNIGGGVLWDPSWDHFIEDLSKGMLPASLIDFSE